jgi:hypothetical protein
MKRSWDRILFESVFEFLAIANTRMLLLSHLDRYMNIFAQPHHSTVVYYMKYYFIKSLIFLEYLFPYITPGSEIKLQYYDVHFTCSYVRHIDTTDCTTFEKKRLGWFQWHNILTKFHENPLVGANVEIRTYRHTYKSAWWSRNLCVYCRVVSSMMWRGVVW